MKLALLATVAGMIILLVTAPDAKATSNAWSCKANQVCLNPVLVRKVDGSTYLHKLVLINNLGRPVTNVTISAKNDRWGKLRSKSGVVKLYSAVWRVKELKPGKMTVAYVTVELLSVAKGAKSKFVFDINYPGIANKVGTASITVSGP